MSGRFHSGDHLQVQRPSLYYHHGIYISDDRVIQFGNGVSLVNKRGVGINAVALKDFEQGGTAAVVRHGYYSLFTGWHPPADESWKIVERAEFLLELQPRLPYNLVGHNCEIIANMCVSGGWTESYQARRYFGVRAYMDAALMFWIGSRSRAKLPLPKWVFPLVVAGAVTSMGIKFIYDDQIRRFWNEIRDDWRAHERMLAHDPRGYRQLQADARGIIRLSVCFVGDTTSWPVDIPRPRPAPVQLPLRLDALAGRAVPRRPQARSGRSLPAGTARPSWGRTAGGW